ncbi:MAG: hypothetical protein Q9162_001627 [Coniocarpon cinnabarinum]
MGNKPHTFLFTAAALLLSLTALVGAQHQHGGGGLAEMEGMGADGSDHGGATGGAHHMKPPTSEDARLWGLPSYWELTEHVGLMRAHITVMIIAWVIILPLTVMVSIARSKRLIIPAHLAFLIANGLGVYLSVIYDAKTPDRYPSNAHHKMGWIFTWLGVAWASMSILRTFTTTKHDGYQRISNEALAEHQQMTAGAQPISGFHNYRWSRDSGQGTEPNTASLTSNSRTNSWNSSNGNLPFRKHYRDFSEAENEEDVGADSDDEKRGFLRGSTAADRFVMSKLSRFSPGSRAVAVMSFFAILLERCILVFGFVEIATGWVTYAGTAKGHHVFNTLAHLIKGGIFFVYGFLTFGRWLGCFADFGWAWNVKPPAETVGKAKSRVPSAEFVESFVIFLYGASNVFLEHLTAWGEEWSAMDLEHISITVMFFGGGLLGMLIESRVIRRLMNSALASPFQPQSRHLGPWEEPKQTTIHSMNPMPAVVIFLLGVMMSSHTQHTPVSAAIHKHWGLLFAGFSLSRVFTYIVMYLKPPGSYFPSRPPTEIISAFCLVSGGLIFMASNSDTVHSLENQDLDAMFVFTVVMGLTGLLLAWSVAVVAFKNWLCKRAHVKLANEPGPVQNSIRQSAA